MFLFNHLSINRKEKGKRKKRSPTYKKKQFIDMNFLIIPFAEYFFFVFRLSCDIFNKSVRFAYIRKSLEILEKS